MRSMLNSLTDSGYSSDEFEPSDDPTPPVIIRQPIDTPYTVNQEIPQLAISAPPEVQNQVEANSPLPVMTPNLITPVNTRSTRELVIPRVRRNGTRGLRRFRERNNSSRIINRRLGSSTTQAATVPSVITPSTVSDRRIGQKIDNTETAIELDNFESNFFVRFQEMIAPSKIETEMESPSAVRIPTPSSREAFIREINRIEVLNDCESALRNKEASNRDLVGFLEKLETEMRILTEEIEIIDDAIRRVKENEKKLNAHFQLMEIIIDNMLKGNEIKK